MCPAQVKHSLQTVRVCSLHMTFPHLQQAMLQLALLFASVQKSHRFLPLHFPMRGGAASRRFATIPAAADERGRRPLFLMCGVTSVSPTSSMYSLCLYGFRFGCHDGSNVHKT